MRVNTKIRMSWKFLEEHGDIKKICEGSKTINKPNGISRVTISNALRTGRMNDETFTVIQNFYKTKKEEQLKFIKENIIPVDDLN